MNLTWPDANQVSYDHLEIVTLYKDNELFLKPMFFRNRLHYCSLKQKRPEIKEELMI